MFEALTQKEIWCTSFHEILHKEWKTTYGWAHPDRDKNQMCPYCKNEDTDVVRDEAYLVPFKEFYKDRKFTVVSCWCCNAVFSYWRD